MGNIRSYLEQILYTIPVLLVAFPVHEFAHALTAYILGDRTAKYQGRLTLNPFKHLNLLGTLCLILMRFGWAEPVPVNPSNFKNPRAGMAVTALAGPFANLVLGFVSVLTIKLLGVYVPGTPNIIMTLLYYSAVININLTVFNLIPLPPLDGSKVLELFLPSDVVYWFNRNANILQIITMALVITGFLTTPLVYFSNAIINAMDKWTNSIFSLFL